MNRVGSYTSADNIPVKMLLNEELISSINRCKRIVPVHVQLMPTNKCNMNCSFCSCSEEDRSIEMSREDLIGVVNTISDLGTQAIAITGGGDPLMHPDLDMLIAHAYSKGIDVGLVTNGLRLDKIENVDLLTWCRISNHDSRNFTDKYRDMLLEVASSGCVDWAFSHVVSGEPNYDEMVKIINFANDNGFTHVRLVADLLQPHNVNMPKVENTLKELVDDSIVIYQPRKTPRRGGPCYICYLKPVIGADMNVYACCGAQYALRKKSKKMPKELCLGSVYDLDKIIKNSRKPFDGSVCYRCYYSDYNKILGQMMLDIDHMSFV